jgi:hypothetical protein
VSFSQVTSRARKRTYQHGILEGWMDGMELAVTDYPAAMWTAQRQVYMTIRNSWLIKTGVQNRSFIPESMYLQEEGKAKKNYFKIMHSQFTVETLVGKIKNHMVKVAMPDGTFRDGLYLGHTETLRYSHKNKAGEDYWWINGKQQQLDIPPIDNGKEGAVIWFRGGKTRIVPVERFRPDLKGKTFRIDRNNDIYVQEALYAPKKMAKHWNNVLHRSKLEGIPGIDQITRINAELKKIILLTSFFHQWAFWRSAGLGGKHGLTALNPYKLYKEGQAAILANQEFLMNLVRHGMTMGKVLDYDLTDTNKNPRLRELAQSENSLFSATGHVLEGIYDIADRYERFLFGKFGATLKAHTGILEVQSRLKKLYESDAYTMATEEQQQEMEAREYKAVAKLMNNDFGGINYEREGWSPTAMHAGKLGFLGFDWTMSNVKSMIDFFKKGEIGEVHRMFWMRIAARSIAMTLAFNLLMAFADPEDERFKKAVQAGNLRWMGVDVTPIAHLLGGDPDIRKYFSIAGHFLDPIKFVTHPLQSMRYKSSVIGRLVLELMGGQDFAHRTYTSVGELLGVEQGGKLRGKTTSWKSKKHAGPIDYDQYPSFLLRQVKSNSPIQVQKVVDFISGEIDGFDTLTQMAGMTTQTTYKKRRQITAALNKMSPEERKKFYDNVTMDYAEIKQDGKTHKVPLRLRSKRK